MSLKNRKRMIAALLLTAMMLSGCGAASTQAEAPTETQAVTEPAGPRYQVDWAKDAVIYEVNVRQYTREGTFAAFGEHLQTLKDMGINTLWFMPIHPISLTKRSGPLGSYYSATDYRKVNPEFGTAEDFKALVEQAHSMGFHVMLDWVANHTGWDSAWIKEHPDWYTQDESGNVISPAAYNWPDVADLNYDNMDMRQEMIACMKYWVEEFDVDGFRCDFAYGVPQDFWEAARRELETVKPVLMLAEDDMNVHLLDSAFDMNYNLGLYNTLVAVAHDAKTADKIKLYIPSSFPDGTYTLNFLDNHDMNSYERTIMEGIGRDALPSMFSLIYTLPGTPMVYTGNEIGYDHAIAFMSKDTINWGASDVDYRSLLAELSAIRSSNPALFSGNYGGPMEYADMGKKNVFAFTREMDGSKVICLFNLTKRESEVDLTGFFEGGTALLHGIGADVLEMEDQPITLDGTVTLQPWEFYIISNH